MKKTTNYFCATPGCQKYIDKTNSKFWCEACHKRRSQRAIDGTDEGDIITVFTSATLGGILSDSGNDGVIQDDICIADDSGSDSYTDSSDDSGFCSYDSSSDCSYDSGS